MSGRVAAETTIYLDMWQDLEVALENGYTRSCQEIYSLSAPMKNPGIEIVGWYGTIAILLAYALLSFGVITSSSFAYQFLNLTGGIGIIVVSLKKKTYQPAVLNIVWSIIALGALLRILL